MFVFAKRSSLFGNAFSPESVYMLMYGMSKVVMPVISEINPITSSGKLTLNNGMCTSSCKALMKLQICWSDPCKSAFSTAFITVTVVLAVDEADPRLLPNDSFYLGLIVSKLKLNFGCFVFTKWVKFSYKLKVSYFSIYSGLSKSTFIINCFADTWVTS